MPVPEPNVPDPHVEGELLSLADGTLAGRERLRVLEHVARCPPCRRRYDDLRFTHGLLAGLPAEELPPQRAAEIRAAWTQRPAHRIAAAARRSSRRWLATLAATILVAIVAASSLHTQAEPEWPGWRGPRRDGKSADTGLLRAWPAGGPPLAWQASGLGEGYASVAVAGGRLYTMGDAEGSQDVLALDARNGRLLWRRRIGPAWQDRYVGPRATPTVDGGQVYVMSTGGVVVCLDAASGEERWRRDLVRDYGARLMKRRNGRDWRFSESPLVDGGRIVVTPGTASAALVALDTGDGRELWRAAVPDLGAEGTDGAGYSSVVVSEGAGVRQYVQFLGRGLVGVEAATGRFLWGYNPIANRVANVTTPVVLEDYVFASNGFGKGSVLLHLLPAAGGVTAKEVYHLPSRVLTSEHGGLIVHDGYVYSGTGRDRGRPICLELATGRVAWGPVRNGGDSTAAVVYADGRLYFRYEDGRVVLVEATPDGYREHGRLQIPDVRRASWAHPVVAGGRLYLREQDRLLTYDISS